MNAILKPVAQSTLDDLVIKLVAAKGIEDDAKRARIAIEEQIVDAIQTKEEGSISEKVASGYTITVTGKLNYKADNIAKLLEATRAWADNMRPIKTKVELDETGCKYLRTKEPELWAQIASGITITPAKFAVKVSV